MATWRIWQWPVADFEPTELVGGNEVCRAFIAIASPRKASELGMGFGRLSSHLMVAEHAPKQLISLCDLGIAVQAFPRATPSKRA